MKNKALTPTILSLSLLTVMAGAAVAPALSVIKEYFSDISQIYVQMIISVPAVFIAATNFVFPYLCKKFGTKTLALSALALYIVAGCLAGAFSNIFLVLIMRALVGVGVGIIMPLSTGLLSYYFPPEDQGRLMGYSSAMNQMGGVIAVLFAGLLASISWRASFLVYLMGAFSMILCIIFLPNARLQQKAPDSDTEVSANEGSADMSSAARNEVTAAEKYNTSESMGVLKNNITYVLCMFLLMSAFFVYPSNFAIETASAGIIPTKYVTIIMVMLDLVAFIGGLAFVKIKALCGTHTRFFAPLCFLIGYILMVAPGGWVGTLAGSAIIGLANGAGVPFIISEASARAGKRAAVTVMPLISAALYLAQFASPFITSAVSAIFGNVAGLPYITAIVISLLLIICSAFMPRTKYIHVNSSSVSEGIHS